MPMCRTIERRRMKAVILPWTSYDTPCELHPKMSELRYLGVEEWKTEIGTALEIPCTMAQRTTAISTASTAGLWSWGVRTQPSTMTCAALSCAIAMSAFFYLALWRLRIGLGSTITPMILFYALENPTLRPCSFIGIVSSVIGINLNICSIYCISTVEVYTKVLINSIVYGIIAFNVFWIPNLRTGSVILM